MEQFPPSGLAARHETLQRATLLTCQVGVDVGLERHDPSPRIPSKHMCVGLIHIHVMHNLGPRPKVILSEAGDIIKSMMMWLILTRVHDHSGANQGEIMQ